MQRILAGAWYMWQSGLLVHALCMVGLLGRLEHRNMAGLRVRSIKVPFDTLFPCFRVSRFSRTPP